MSLGPLLTVLLASAVSIGDDKAASPPFHDQLREIAKTYKSYKPVDFDAKFAPFLCRVPIPFKDYQPSEARFSASKDGETHGQKMYFLFAKQKDAYVKLAVQTNLVGQIIIKESWIPEEAKEEDYKQYVAKHTDRSGPIPFARRGAKLYRTAKQAELFVMFKLDPQTPNTDNGWVYGTVTPDGKTVTSAGRVESCMSCHKDAKHDRLFGLKTSTPAADPKTNGK